jgi:mercuric ion transport protein
MNDRVLIRTGIAGAAVAAVCCVTPILAVLLPLVGLGAWLASADLFAFSLLAASLGLIGWGLYHRHGKADGCETENKKESLTP